MSSASTGPTLIPPPEPVRPGAAGAPEPRPVRVALLGNPNTGKTTLFNRLSGLRHKTSNFPGTTLEARLGRVTLAGGAAELIDLPGIYSLELDQLEAAVCRDVLAGQAAPRGDPLEPPGAICVVADATNLGRNLLLVGEALRRRLPTVVAVNMIDLARRQGLRVEAARLVEALGCGVVCISARTGEGIDELRAALAEPRIPTHTPPGDPAGLRAWADAVFTDAASGPDAARCAACGRDLSGQPDRGRCPGCGTRFDRGLADTMTDRADRVLTHPVAGTALFALVMATLFYGLFSIAQYPMGWIEGIFAWATGMIEASMAEGILRDLLANGVVAGVGATVVFLPQICLLFFLISLLEDTGYLARAAFLMNRLLRPFGLPGHAFVPLLSSHACAIPGIMACRAIPDRRERLATILVAPFMTCSARLPVYVLLISLLFAGRPAMAALAFVGCYALGIAAGVLSALLARQTILRGRSRPMALELPSYKRPSLRTALMTTYDRGLMFLRKAGTVILAISVVLWWLGSYPKVTPPEQVVALRAAADRAEADGSGRVAWSGREGSDAVPLDAAGVRAVADELEAKHAAANSFMGRIGRAAQPVFAPLGYDWQLTVGVMASFAAREVFVTTMSVVIAGQEEAEDAEGEARLVERIATATRGDALSTPIFTPAVCWSLLVYYVLAMQCLPTIAVTARESGHWKWAALQLVWMCGVAYLAALGVYQVLK